MNFKSFSLTFIAVLAIFYYNETEKILGVSMNSWEQDHVADCGIVLTGGAGRITEGFDLLAQENIRHLIISGVYPGAELLEIFPKLPFYGNIQPSQVILEKRSRTTFGNVQQSLPLIEALRCRDVVLITSSTHMYRAHRLFQKYLPHDFPLQARATMNESSKWTMVEVMLEATKSLFYSVWAY